MIVQGNDGFSTSMLVYPRASSIFIRLYDHLFMVQCWSQQCCHLLLIFLHSKSCFSLGKLQYDCHKAEIITAYYCYFGIVAQIENPYSSEVTVRPTWIFHILNLPTWVGILHLRVFKLVNQIWDKVEPRLTTSFHGHVSYVFGCLDLLASIHGGDKKKKN